MNQASESFPSAQKLPLRRAREIAGIRAASAVEKMVRSSQWAHMADADTLRFFDQFDFHKLPDGRVLATEVDTNGDFYFGDSRTISWTTESALASYYYSCLIMRATQVGMETVRELTGRSNVIRYRPDPANCVRLAYSRLRNLPGYTYRSPWDALEPIAKSAAKRLFDQTAYELAVIAANRFPSLADYNRIVIDIDEWTNIKNQAPGLLRLVNWALAEQHIQWSKNVLADLRRWFLDQGMTKAEWKLVARLSISKMNNIFTQWNPAQQSFAVRLIQVARHWVEVGQLPTSDILRIYLRQTRFGLEIPIWFDRAAIGQLKTIRGTENKRAFLRDSYSIAIDWLRAYVGEGHRPDANQKSQGWTWIDTQSNAWHERMIKTETVHNQIWQSAIDPYQDGDYEIVPLTSSLMLQDEGRKMHHCVGGYASLCAAGHSRIFSIQRNGERISTAELRPTAHGGWQLCQNRAHCNRDPGEEAHQVAQRLAERYSRAVRRSA